MLSLAILAEVFYLPWQWQQSIYILLDKDNYARQGVYIWKSRIHWSQDLRGWWRIETKWYDGDAGTDTPIVGLKMVEIFLPIAVPGDRKVSRRTRKLPVSFDRLQPDVYLIMNDYIYPMNKRRRNRKLKIYQLEETAGLWLQTKCHQLILSHVAVLQNVQESMS